MRLTSPILSILLVFSIAMEEARAQEVFRFDIEGPDQLFAHEEEEDDDDEDEIASHFFALLDPPDDLGAQAWCIGLQAEGGAITRISFDDTSVPHFMKRGGFVSNEITKGIGNEGAVSCVVLSPRGSSTLPPGKTKKILKIKFESTAGPTCKEAALRCVDGLTTARGDVVNNTVTEGGVTRPAEKGLKRFQIAPVGGICLKPNGDDGWIHTGAWNFLFPLTNPYGCSGGGPQNMLRAWAGGEELFKAAPQAGDQWPLIQYQVADAVTGFEATHFFSELGLGDEAIWSSLEWLALQTENFIQPPGACDPPAHLDCPAVDYQAILDRLNELAATLGIARISSDNTLAVAQTYVRNRTESPVCVNVCFASDDSGQVRVNGRLVINRSACRELAEDCEDTGTVFLDPGVNQITVFTWEGEGDWGFRLALLDDTGLKLTPANQDFLEFLGTTPDAGIAPDSRPRVLRQVADPSANPLTVSLTAAGVPAGGSLTVREEIQLPGAVLDVSEVSNGGSVAAIQGGLEILWNVEASVLSSPGITYRLSLPPGATVEPVGTVNGCDRVAAAAGARVLHGSWPRTGPLGFFDDSQDVGATGRFTGGPGEFSFTPGPDGEPSTPDDEYVIKGSGDDVGDSGDAFRFAYLGFAGDFQCTVRVKTRVFPASGGRFGRYGLMVRRDTSPTSKFSLVHANLEADPGPQSDHPRGDNVAWQFRRSHGSAAPTSEAGFVFPDPDGDGPEIVNQPNWFRILRRGPLFSGYASFDGITWKLVGSDTWYGLNPNDRLLVGLMYSRHSSASEAGTITFTDFSIGPPPPLRLFDNDENRPGSMIFRADFDGVPDGSLPGNIFANCGDSCAFTPRVFGGRLRLSQEGQTSNATSAFLDVEVPIDAASVTIEYTLFARHSGVTMRPPSGDPNPGDGIACALVAGTHTNLVGTAGSGLGYDGLTRRFDAAKPSFAVEADTWAGTFFNEGTGSPGNDGAWHLGINSGGNTNCVALNAASDLPDLFAPEGVRHRLIYTPDGRVSVFILPQDQGIGAGPPEATPAAETQVEPLSSQGDSTGTIGFTAGTGDSSQTSEVDDIEVIVVPCSDSSERAAIEGPAIAGPNSLVMLDAGASDAGADDSSELPSLVFHWSVTGDAVIVGPSDGPTVLLRTGDIVGDGEAIGRVEIDDLRCTTPVSATQDHRIDIRRALSVSYDGNSDGDVNISDPVFHLNFLFGGGREPACDETMDFDGDGEKNITDPVACLNYLFSNGSPPARGAGCQPHPGCGEGVGCE